MVTASFAAGSLGHAAVTYATAGMPVFRLQPGTKIPFARTRGFLDATTDVAVVTSLWNSTPDANVGIRTGVAIDVLDVDVRADGNGWDALDQLRRAGLLKGAIARASTRNGGLHLMYPASGSGCRSWKEHHLDVKGVGGYIVAPPSIVPCDDGVDGPGRYEWLEFGKKGTGQPLDVPGIGKFLNPPLNTLNTPRTSSGAADGDRLVAWVGRLVEGDRNGGLFWAAIKAHQGGVLTDELERRLIDAAVATGQTQREAEATVRSARRPR